MVEGRACKISRSPILSQIHDVIEGVIAYRESVFVPEEAWHRIQQLLEAEPQEEIQEFSWCEAAAVRRLGDLVVVSKARPMKQSNGVEGKTKPTISLVW